MTLQIILIVLCCSLFFLVVGLSLKLYQFSIILMNIEDAVEDSLDILDEKYKSMNKILDKPVFFDSMEVRQVISDIRDCHKSVLVIANKLTKDMGLSSGEIEKENSKKIKES